MKDLEINEKKAEKLDKLETSAIDIMVGVFEGKKDSEEAKDAIKVMNIVAKNRVTQTARMALGFNMASAIANEKELKRYIEVTSPQIKALTKGKKI